MRQLLRLFAMPARFHFWGSLVIVLALGVTISAQVADRYTFAASELYDDVISRWGAPIVQPVPSVRYVESGSVFNSLEALPLAGQDVAVEATMNYRKRGLVYFSGFDFSFRASYRIENDRGKTIDLVFVFPIQMSKNAVLLSDLQFRVNGEPQPVDLAADADRLVWTGRLADGEAMNVDIEFAGRGLDAFTYQLDPALPVRDFRLAMNIRGGDHFDYEDGVVPASAVTPGNDEVSLVWELASLQSGVPVGVRLPSEKTYDQLLLTMVRRSYLPFLFFFAAMAALSVYFQAPLLFYEGYLLASFYGFFYVLLAYLAAFMHFYAAYPLSLTVIGALVLFHLTRILGKRAGAYVFAVYVAFQVVPTLAVVLEGYTGLIYTLEILAGLITLTKLSAVPLFRKLVSDLETPLDLQEQEHAV